jgi:hypothetical protein
VVGAAAVASYPVTMDTSTGCRWACVVPPWRVCDTLQVCWGGGFMHIFLQTCSRFGWGRRQVHQSCASCYSSSNTTAQASRCQWHIEQEAVPKGQDSKHPQQLLQPHHTSTHAPVCLPAGSTPTAQPDSSASSLQPPRPVAPAMRPPGGTPAHPLAPAR